MYCELDNGRVFNKEFQKKEYFTDQDFIGIDNKVDESILKVVHRHCDYLTTYQQYLWIIAGIKFGLTETKIVHKEATFSKVGFLIKIKTLFPEVFIKEYLLYLKRELSESFFADRLCVRIQDTPNSYEYSIDTSYPLNNLIRSSYERGTDPVFVQLS